MLPQYFSLENVTSCVVLSRHLKAVMVVQKHEGRNASVRTCDLSGQLPHGRKTLGSLSHTNGTTGIQDIEAMAQLQQVLVARDWQLLCQ